LARSSLSGVRIGMSDEDTDIADNRWVWPAPEAERARASNEQLLAEASCNAKFPSQTPRMRRRGSQSARTLGSPSVEIDSAHTIADSALRKSQRLLASLSERLFEEPEAETSPRWQTQPFGLPRSVRVRAKQPCDRSGNVRSSPALRTSDLDIKDELTRLRQHVFELEARLDIKEAVDGLGHQESCHMGSGRCSDMRDLAGELARRRGQHSLEEEEYIEGGSYKLNSLISRNTRSSRPHLVNTDMLIPTSPLSLPMMSRQLPVLR